MSIYADRGYYFILTTHKFNVTELSSYRSSEYCVVTYNVEGNTKEIIKSTISERENVRNIIIVGSASDVPSGGQNDLYYSDNNGDGIVDIPVGRLLVYTQQDLDNAVNKIIKYETEQQYNLHGVLFTAGSEAVPPASGWKTATYFEQNVTPVFTGWNKLAFYCTNNPQGYINPYITNQDYPLNWINGNQVSIIGFQGHSYVNGGYLYMGCPERLMLLPMTDLDRRTNTHYPIFVAFACTTVTTNAGSSWFSTKSVNSEHEFVAFVGANVDGGDFPVNIWKHLTQDRTLGEAFVNSIKDVTQPCNGCDGNYFRTQLSSDYMLMGDPALRIN
jgi:hypothetical protein